MAQKPLDPELRDHYLSLASVHESKEAMARAEDIATSTLDSRLRSLGIREEVSTLNLKVKMGISAGDVTTREGRREANQQALVTDLKKRNRDLESRLLNQENFFDRIVAESTQPLPKPNFKIRASKSEKPSRHVLLPLFDVQYGQRVRSQDTVGGIGGFDSSVFKKRLETYIEKVSALMQSYAAGHSLESLVFALGGDMVEGINIFKGQEWHLELDPAEQVMNMHDYLAYGIDALMEVGASLGIKKASVVCVPGNHGKPNGRQGGATPPTYNFDVLLYMFLKRRLANHPIHTFAIEPAGSCMFEIAGNLFGMIHGDEVRGWGGLPLYGLTRQDARSIRTLNVIPDTVLLGHHHQPASIPIGYGEYIMSGNWVGANNLSKIVGSNTPSQWALGVSEEHGVCDRFLIYLDSIRKPTPYIHSTA